MQQVVHMIQESPKKLARKGERSREGGIKEMDGARRSAILPSAHRDRRRTGPERLRTPAPIPRIPMRHLRLMRACERRRIEGRGDDDGRMREGSRGVRDCRGVVGRESVRVGREGRGRRRVEGTEVFGRGGEEHLGALLNLGPLDLALRHVAFRAVVQPQPEEGHRHPRALDPRNLLAGPDDGEADDGDALDEGRDRVGDGGGAGENGEGEEVLGEMDAAVEDKVDEEGGRLGRRGRVGGRRRRFLVRPRV